MDILKLGCSKKVLPHGFSVFSLERMFKSRVCLSATCCTCIPNDPKEDDGEIEEADTSPFKIKESVADVLELSFASLQALSMEVWHELGCGSFPKDGTKFSFLSLCEVDDLIVQFYYLFVVRKRNTQKKCVKLFSLFL